MLECIDEEGEVNMGRLLELQRIQMEEMDDFEEWVTALAEEEDAVDRGNQKRDARSVTSNRSRRSVKKRNTLLYRDTDGTVKPLKWDKSLWYLNYLENPRPGDSKWNDKFRKRFRMPHESFVELGMMAEACPKFDRWKKKDAVGQRAAPTRLMLLGALRYLGRGWTFDDIEEATGIHQYPNFHQIFWAFLLLSSRKQQQSSLLCWPDSFLHC